MAPRRDQITRSIIQRLKHLFPSLSRESTEESHQAPKQQLENDLPTERGRQGSIDTETNKASVRQNQTKALLGSNCLTIILAEDNSNLRRNIRLQLEEIGHQVLEATDGAQAIAQAETNRPDVILMDLSMPGMDGRRAVKLIRQHHDSVLSDIPVIGMSNQVSFGVDPTSGFSDIITKPFDDRILIKALKKATIDGAFIPSDQMQEEAPTPILSPKTLEETLREIGPNEILLQISNFADEAETLARNIFEEPSPIRLQAADKLSGLARNLGLIRLEETASGISKGNSPTSVQRIIHRSSQALNEWKRKNL